MYSYENEQTYIAKLWDEFMSDEDNEEPFAGDDSASDNSESSNSSKERPPIKKT